MPGPDGTRTSHRWRRADAGHQLPPGRPARRPDRADPDAGLVGLLRSLAEDTATLVRQEVELVKLELGGLARRLAADGAWIATGGAIAAVGGLCLVIAMALGLGALLGSYWLGTLLTGIFLGLLGGGLVWKGVRDLRRAELAPRETADSLKEDARWARDEAQELKQRLVED